MSFPTANLLDLPLEVRAELAIKEAVQEAVEQHNREGLPIYIWRDGKVAELSPDELHAQRNRSR
jgi:hypothetical protein